MQKIGVIFGGRSVEHEVSVITGMQIIENLDTAKYQAVPIYWTKEGKFLTGDCLKNFSTYKNGDFSKAIEVFPLPVKGDYSLHQFPKAVGLFGKMTDSVIETVDFIFPALHGTYGEDGCIQGLFELMDIPYAGCGVLAAAVGMDKIVMKDVFKTYNIPVVDYLWFYRKRWMEESDVIVNSIEENLGFPVIVKPANLGSSVGISMASDADELCDAVEIAVRYDRKIIVEKAVVNAREINCAVLGTDDYIETSLLEEPVGWKEILSYEDKYMSNAKSGVKMSEGKRRIPADVPDDIRESIENLAKDCFIAIDASGTARIDFLVDTEMNVYANEINTLPGSIGFYLWEKKGLAIKELISRLIELGFERNKDRKSNICSIDVNLYDKVAYGSKIK